MSDSKSRAVVYMLGSAFSFALMGACVKLAGDVPVVQKVAFRNFISLLIAAWFVYRHRKRFFGRRSSQPLLLVRSLLGLGGVAAYFYAIERMFLADSAMLNKLSPFFVTLFAAMWLKERLTPMKLFTLVVAFVGAILVIKPEFDLSMLPALAAAGSAVLAGGAYVLVRHLRGYEAPETIVFYFSLVSVVGLAPFVLIDPVMPEPMQWLWMLGIGLGAAGGQFGLTFAYRFAPASEIAIYNYTSILFSAVLGWAIFFEVPDGFSVAGGGLIILAGSLSFWAMRRNPSNE